MLGKAVFPFQLTCVIPLWLQKCEACGPNGNRTPSQEAQNHEDMLHVKHFTFFQVE